MNPLALLEELDDDQRRAVTCPPSATIVHAGAGSGKTRVLTHRIAWRIAEGGVDPSRVLAITFTRETAAEMRRRLRALGVTRHDRPGDVDQPTIGTFHAVALALLRRRATDTSSSVPTIVGNRVSLLDQALGEHSLGRQSHAVLAEIDWAHARMVSPDRYVREVQRVGRAAPIDPQRIAMAYAAYEQLKAKRGLADLELKSWMDTLRMDSAGPGTLRLTATADGDARAIAALDTLATTVASASRQAAGTVEGLPKVEIAGASLQPGQVTFSTARPVPDTAARLGRAAAIFSGLVLAGFAIGFVLHRSIVRSRRLVDDESIVA